MDEQIGLYGCPGAAGYTLSPGGGGRLRHA